MVMEEIVAVRTALGTRKAICKSSRPLLLDLIDGDDESSILSPGFMLYLLKKWQLSRRPHHHRNVLLTKWSYYVTRAVEVIHGRNILP